jgi:hypothetical protein
MATRLCCIANAWPPGAGHNAPRNCDAPGNSVRVMDCAGKAPAATALSHARAGRELLRTVARTKAAWRFPPQSRTPRANLKGWKPGVERPGSDTPGKRPHPPAPRRRCQKFPLEITTTTRRRSRRPTTRATRTRRRCSFSTWGKVRMRASVNLASVANLRKSLGRADRDKNRGWKIGNGFHVARPSSAASAGTVPVPGSGAGKLPAQGTGGETPPKLAGEDARAT